MKHITKTALLLVLLVAVTVLAGCPKEPEINGDYPGTWVQKSLPQYQEAPAEAYFYSCNGQKVTFHFDSADKDEAPDNLFDSLAQGDYNWFWDRPFRDERFTGFEGTALKTAGHENAGYGFMFDAIIDRVNNDNTALAFYQVVLCNSEYEIYCQYPNAETHEQERHFFTEGTNHWVTDSHVNPIGTENKIKVFTKKDGKIAVYINDYLVQEITPLTEYTQGKAYLLDNATSTMRSEAVCEISGVDYSEVNSSNPNVVIQFRYNKFQTQP